MALAPNFSAHLTHKAKLAAIAKQMGYVQMRKGVARGNIKALLEAIAIGRVKLFQHQKLITKTLTRTEQKQLLLQNSLLAKGIISEIRLPSQVKRKPTKHLVVPGKPVSETLLEERR